MKDILLSLFTFIVSFLFVILFIALGWYIVWKLFLSKFKFVQEILGKNGGESSEEKPRKTRSKLRKD